MLAASVPSIGVAAPTAAQVAVIEAAYAPPSWSGRSAGPPSAYVRSYWRDLRDPDLIVGQYVAPRPGDGPRGVRLFASGRPDRFVFDGGCGVVNIRYRLSTAALEARCGGR